MKKAKKLVLSRETVRVLLDPTLQNVAGGAWSDTVCPDRCVIERPPSAQINCPE